MIDTTLSDTLPESFPTTLTRVVVVSIRYHSIETLLLTLLSRAHCGGIAYRQGCANADKAMVRHRDLGLRVPSDGTHYRVTKSAMPGLVRWLELP